MTVHSFSEAIKLIEEHEPMNVDFFNECCTLNEVIEIAEKYDYYINPTGFMNVTRLSKDPNNSIVQIARNNDDLERLLK